MHCNCESIEQLLNLVRKYTKDFELNEAVEQAVNECIHDNILSDFLRANKAEVISMSIFEYDKELEERKLRKAEYEAGVADGIKTATENIKREDALSLVDLGLSVEQIATALKIDLKTIQNGLSKTHKVNFTLVGFALLIFYILAVWSVKITLLHSNLDLVAFDFHYATLVISVSGYPWTADDFIAIFF